MPKKQKKKFTTRPHHQRRSGPASIPYRPSRPSPAEFTLEDEARETSRKVRSPWNNNARLRHQPIVFTSAGIIRPLDPPTDDDDGGGDASPTDRNREIPENVAHHINLASRAQAAAVNGVPPPENADFEIRTTEDADDTSSDDEEILVFQGRGRHESANSPHLPHASDEGIFGSHMVLDDDEDGGVCTSQFNEQRADLPSTQTANTPVGDVDVVADSTEAEATDGGSHTSRNQFEARQKDPADEDLEHDTAMDDYIANVLAAEADDASTELGFRYLDLGLRASEEPTDAELDDDDGFLDDFFLDCAPPSRGPKKSSAHKYGRHIDPELEAAMNKAFEMDRRKQSEKKRERQRLRAVSMAQSQALPAESGTLDHTIQAIKEFLMSDLQSITLLPVGVPQRKVVHELAHRLNLVSKSVGRAQTRRPTLARTNGTLRMTSAEFDHTACSVMKRNFMLADARKSHWGVAFIASRGRGGGIAPKEGDIVGASLPELGSANRGRVMLEKMGWSSGTALGSETNRGILQPVAHIVKKGKSGLGQQGRFHPSCKLGVSDD